MDLGRIESQVSSQINELTTEAIRKLKKIWTETFELDMCESNLRKLPEHVTLFYKEVYLETESRQNMIKEKIEKLRDESAMLSRLLHVKIDFEHYDNIPLYTAQMRLDASIRDLREQYQIRKDQIFELLLEQESLCEELGESGKCLLDDPLPTEEDLQDFRLHLEALKAEKNNRLYTISTYRRQIKNLTQELEIPIPSEHEELLNAHSIQLTKENVVKLKDLHDNYSNQMDEIRESINTMKKKLNELWICLEESLSVRKKFDKMTDYSQTTYDQLYRELDRCSELKRQNIKRFVDKIRNEILIMWDKTLKSEVEKSRFSNFTNDCYTEDLLALHEMELEDLKNFYYKNEKIFTFIEERRILWDRMDALDAKASEPGRFNNRGGQLLREEKERKTISSRLPKIETQLIELLDKFETENNKSFTIFGENLKEIISMQWEQREEKKNLIMSARKKNATPTSNRNITALTPISTTFRRNPVLPNSTSSLLSNKKRKLGESSTQLNVPAAKRNILMQLNNPKTVDLKIKDVTSSAKKTFKSPNRRVIATIIKKKPARASGKHRKRKSVMKNIPKLVINDKTMQSEIDNLRYNSFEGGLEKDPASRSSVMTIKKNIEISGIHHLATENKVNLQKKNNLENVMKIKNEYSNSPRLLRNTTSKLNVFEQSNALKSPHRNTPTTSSRKLTTKNLPIII